MASIGAVRFPIVLFDLDGTLIDSGAMIVASMRHAVTTVLGREVPEEELKAAVGGPGLIAQMRALDESRVDELVRGLPRAQRAAARLAPGLRRDRGRAHAARGRGPAARDRDGEAPRHGRSSRSTSSRGSSGTSRWSSAPRTRRGTSRTRSRSCTPSSGSARSPAEAAYVGDSPFDVASAKAAGCFAVAVTWGGIHDEARLAAEEPDAIVHDPEELLAVL